MLLNGHLGPSTCSILINLFANCNNPYQFSEEPVSINSGVAVAAEIKEDLLKANEVRKKCLKNLIDKRIKKNEQNLNDPIKKNMLLTFESTEKKAASKPKGITVALRSDRDTFARLLLIQKDRDIDLKETLQFELTPLPLPLANANGTLSKTVKSKLLAELSKSIPQVTLLLENTVSIFDGMVLFQKLLSTLVTFGDIGDYLLQKIYKNICRIAFFVTDLYMPFSIKSIE